MEHIAHLDINAYREHLERTTGRAPSFKTVNNWLRAGRLPGAQKNERGQWMIPADAAPAPASTGVVATTSAPASTVVVTVAGVLDTQPGYLELDVAARLLGISEHAVRVRRERYRLEPVGHRGRLLMPQAVVREVLGL